ncbi:protein diaphanous homolog 1-like [Chrysemys picta bellii]|uniref:protein diaphanous homolog 1-like n=1 Tax=Chrysemys picta bellii TaxID=8478 RepID=UPI0032B163F0
MGHHVAQLALSISDPDEDISRQAREGVYRLYQLLLRQRELTIREVEDLWCWDWHQDSRLLGYKNTARVGEVFAKFFSEGQRRFFLQTAVLAMHDPLLRVSQAGLLLTYSLLGQTEQLMGSKHEVVTAKIMNELHIIRHLRQVPEALQEFCLQGHQQLLLPLNGECSETEWPPSEQESEGPSTRPLEGRAYIAPPPLPVGWPPGPLVDSVSTERPPSEQENEGPSTHPLDGRAYIAPPPSPVGWPPGPLVDSVATERPPSERESKGPPTRPLEGGAYIAPPHSP